MNRFGNGGMPQMPHSAMHNMNSAPGMNRNINVNMGGLGGAGQQQQAPPQQQPQSIASRPGQQQTGNVMGSAGRGGVGVGLASNRSVQPVNAVNMGSMNGGRGGGNPFPPGNVVVPGMRAGQLPPNLGMQAGQPGQGGGSSYNPSSEILAMINKGGGQLPLNVKNIEGVKSTAQQSLGLGGMPNGASQQEVLEGQPSSSAPFDLSEFPSLSGPGRPMVGGSPSEGGTTQSYQHIAASGQVSSGLDDMMKRSGQGTAVKEEDFPALSSSVKGGGAMGMGSGGLNASAGIGSMAQESFLRNSPGNSDRSSPATSAGYAQARQPWAAPASSSSSTKSSGASGADAAREAKEKTDRFGLLGLLGVIHMTDQNLNILALGQDLTGLGLNLNSPECLYATFESPWADYPSRREPDYCIPLCYYMQPPMLKTSHFAKFHLETLMYVFYNMPGDQMQMYAAQELYRRDWRYHKELKTWFCRAPNTEVQMKTQQYERGSYVYFDVTTWERMQKDNYLLSYDQLEDRSFFEK